jgi:hypothetical protein
VEALFGLGAIVAGGVALLLSRDGLGRPRGVLARIRLIPPEWERRRRLVSRILGFAAIVWGLVMLLGWGP